MEKTIEQMVCLPPTHPSRFQQERKVGKVKMISSRICKLSYSVGKRTLKIVTWGRPVSLISSILSLLPPQSANPQSPPAVFVTEVKEPCFQSHANILGNTRAKSKILWLGV